MTAIKCPLESSSTSVHIELGTAASGNACANLPALHFMSYNTQLTQHPSQTFAETGNVTLCFQWKQQLLVLSCLGSYRALIFCCLLSFKMNGRLQMPKWNQLI